MTRTGEMSAEMTGQETLRIRFHEGWISRRVELSEDVALDVDENNRVMLISIRQARLPGELHVKENPGNWLKLVDPEHEDELRTRLENVNDHFRRMAAGVIGDQDALRLLADLYERKSVDLPEYRDAGIPLARLTAASFCEIGAGLIHITDSGMRFIQSLQDLPGPG